MSSYGTPIGKIKGGRFVPDFVTMGVDRLIEFAKKGRLTEDHITQFRKQCKAVSWHDTAERYIKEVSKVMYTVEWIQSVVRLAGKQSLVYDHGDGFLKTIMRGRALDWRTVREIGPNLNNVDVFFFPWIEFGLPPHHGLLEQGLPILMISTDKAISDLNNRWDRDTEIPFRLITVDSVFDWFKDVKCWPDFKAKTWVALPQGTALIVEGMCLPGPSRRKPQ